MRKANGFVFVETIVVVSVLSITLIILFASYSYILRKSSERNTFDTTEMIYKTYYVKQIINDYKPVSNNLPECSKMGTYNSYKCDLSGSYNGKLIQLKKAFEVDKIYLLTPSEILKSANKKDWLNQFDATTIDYIINLGTGVDYQVMIVKYKKTYNKTDGTYEVFHSSMEVASW